MGGTGRIPGQTTIALQGLSLFVLQADRGATDRWFRQHSLPPRRVPLNVRQIVRSGSFRRGGPVLYGLVLSSCCGYHASKNMSDRQFRHTGTIIPTRTPAESAGDETDSPSGPILPGGPSWKAPRRPEAVCVFRTARPKHVACKTRSSSSLGDTFGDQGCTERIVEWSNRLENTAED